MLFLLSHMICGFLLIRLTCWACLNPIWIESCAGPLILMWKIQLSWTTYTERRILINSPWWMYSTHSCTFQRSFTYMVVVLTIKSAIILIHLKFTFCLVNHVVLPFFPYVVCCVTFPDWGSGWQEYCFVFYLFTQCGQVTYCDSLQLFPNDWINLFLFIQKLCLLFLVPSEKLSPSSTDQCQS